MAVLPLTSNVVSEAMLYVVDEIESLRCRLNQVGKKDNMQIYHCDALHACLVAEHFDETPVLRHAQCGNVVGE